MQTKWKTSRLGDVAEYINGRAFKPEDWKEEGLPIIRIQNLNDLGAPFNYFDDEVDKKYLIDNGDLLVSWSASLDAYIWSRGPAILNQHIFKVHEKTDIIDRHFLYYILKFVMDDIKDKVHGATMKHITKGQFEDVKIPLPPILEQRRIVNILNEQIATIEKAQAAAEEQMEAASCLLDAYLEFYFNPDNNGEVWPIRKFGEITSERLIGLVRSSKEQSIFGQYRYLKMNNITTRGSLQLDSIVAVDATEQEYKKYQLTKGDFLFNTRNSFELVGKTAVFNLDEDGWVYNNNIMRVRFHEKICSDFINWMFLSKGIKKQIDAFKSNTTSVCAIYDRQLVNLDIRCPPINIQKKIVAEINEKAKVVERLNIEMIKLHNELNSLPHRLIHQAFSGKI
ncbi:hypothetical protein GTO91_03110 [Heliobacterium undosum]|uniref:Type I restriction modification DNA specificity domain-containing protein n=1 Tax=Heliomicrobium undosum TaxID=121734 RepID=A0A845L4M0_9FIRM|nr:restriction endonuclease subunit S [Heliomicrobium undosum]MZP28708.1 hypothetical protein [Heliomicrobium undosum]